MNETPRINTTEWSVTELSGALQRTLEDAFGYVRLRGEISGYRGPHSSGHVYFALKDRGAKIDAVMWKGVFQRLRIRPEEGMEVVAQGKITSYPGKSSYQIIVESLEPAGVGALMALLEERRRRLTGEGLFELSRKRRLPFLPRTIGVVTSPTGAVIRDILHRLEDRFSRSVLVWPVRVQGETSADEIAAAIAGFNALPPDGAIPRPDVLIVARGGGSLEDLWSFNEENVVRAAAASHIPIVAAIGHETDWTLIDLVADVRAPTPTGAAEMVVPVRSELAAQVNELVYRYRESWLRLIEGRRRDLRSATRAMPGPDALLAFKRQRLDLIGARMPAGFARHLRGFETRFSVIGRRLQSQTPGARVFRLQDRLAGLGARLSAARQAQKRAERLKGEQDRQRLTDLDAQQKRAFAIMIDRKAAQLDTLEQLRVSLGYQSVLARGFALVRHETGKTVRLAADLKSGQRFSIQFSDGSVSAIRQAIKAEA